MIKSSPVYQLMQSPLPIRTYQRRKGFRPSHEEVVEYYNLINCYVFNNTLRLPEIRLGAIKQCWGACYWEDELQSSGSYCKIRLNSKWYCQQWFLNTLAHELIHQWQWDIYRFEYENIYNRKMKKIGGGHGPNFYQWRDKFAEHGLTLKISYGQTRWFKHQNFIKC